MSLGQILHQICDEKFVVVFAIGKKTEKQICIVACAINRFAMNTGQWYVGAVRLIYLPNLSD